MCVCVCVCVCVSQHCGRSHTGRILLYHTGADATFLSDDICTIKKQIRILMYCIVISVQNLTQPVLSDVISCLSFICVFSKTQFPRL